MKASLCVYVRVCVCVCEREREGERGRGAEGRTERGADCKSTNTCNRHIRYIMTPAKSLCARFKNVVHVLELWQKIASKLREMVKDRKAWRAAVDGQRFRHDLATERQQYIR